MRRCFGYLILAIMVSCAGATGQTQQRPPAGRARNAASALSKPQPPKPAPASGRVEGFVYWDANAIAHKPAASCSGLAITVSVASSSGGPLEAYTPLTTLSNNFKYVGQVKSFLAGGKVLVYDVCAYGYDHVPVGTDLHVQLAVTQSAAFSPIAAPQVAILGPIKIINAKCNMLPRITNPTAGDLTGHWGTCQNMAYDVNFPMQASAHLLGSGGGSGGLLSGSASAPSERNPGPAGGPLLKNPGPNGTPLLKNPGPIGIPTLKQPGPQGSPSSKGPGPAGTAGNGADDLNPQPLPPHGTAATAASLQRGKMLASKLRLKAGRKIRISGLKAGGLDPEILNALREQAFQAHHQKLALASAGGGTSPRSSSKIVAGTQTRALLGSSAVRPMGSTQVMSSGDPAAGGSTPGGDPAGGAPAGGTSGSTPVQQAGSPSTQIGSSSQGSFLQKAEHAPAPISMCRFTTDPVIENVSGRLHNIVLTPDPGTGQYPNNQYTIQGCNYGALQGKVQVFGKFINHASPVQLGIDTWNDGVIVVTFDPTFQDEYDLKNLTLVVVRTDGKSVQLPGISFYAARASRPLPRVPHSVVKLPTDYLQQDVLISPVTNENLSAAGMGPGTISSTASLAFWLYDPIWSSNVGDGYPATRLSFSDSIDFSQLRPGFVLDPNAQTLLGSYGPDLDSKSWIGVDGGSCKYFDVELSAALQGSKLSVGVEPAECDNSGKFIYAYYGLALSVIGPKGGLLDPWPDGLQ